MILKKVALPLAVDAKLYWEEMILEITSNKFCSLRANFKQELFEQFQGKFYSIHKPIGASPGRDYVLMRMVIQIIQYSTRYGMIHQKRGGTLCRLWIKREREEHVGILILRKPH
jgi:hypothetical protein